MTTPVLFLDDASRHVATVDRARAERSAMTLLETLKRLRKINKRFALNAMIPIAQYQISDNWTLQSILGGSSFKEEWDFIRALNDRSPFSAGLEVGLRQEVDDMEFRTRTSQVRSSALAWASLLDSATVSFDAHPDWSQGWVETGYVALEGDGNVIEKEGRVRNASRAEHADEHIDWLTLLGLSAPSIPSSEKIWKERGERFPSLRFLPRLRKDLLALEGCGAAYLQALSSLESLENDVANWKAGDPLPEFSTKCSREFEQRQKLCWVHDDNTGKEELFDWHLRFTGQYPGRIHFRLDGSTRSAVVAYAGAKLVRQIVG